MTRSANSLESILTYLHGSARATLLLTSALALAACGDGDSDAPDTGSSSPAPAPPITHHIGGSTSGLASGNSVTLDAGSGNALVISANGTFVFSAALAEGTTYSIAITQQAQGQQCTLNNGSGVVGTGDVTDIGLACSDLSGTLGGRLSGLNAGAKLFLSNGTEILPLTADGSFRFAQSLPPGTAYQVTVNLNPSGQSCTVGNGSGTMPAANVTNVTVACAAQVAQEANVALYVGDMGGAGQADGSGTNARFRRPHGVAVVDGDIFVADTSNHAIRRIDANGAVTTFAGTFSEGGSVDGQGSKARFDAPAGIARDGTGNLYVTDSSMNVVRKITPDGTVTTIAGFAGLKGSADGNGSQARFNGPSGIAAFADGTLIVADTNNFTIRRISAQGVVDTIAGVAGQFGSNDTSSGHPALFFSPSDVAIDEQGAIFVADTANNMIRKILTPGEVVTVAGDRTVGDQDGDALAARFRSPLGLAYRNGALYIADSVNNTIRKLEGHTVTTIAGTINSPGPIPIDGDRNAARLVVPIGLAMLGDTTLCVTDNNFDIVRTVTTSGSIATIAGQARRAGTLNPDGFIRPQGIAASVLGDLLVTDSTDHTLRSVATLANNGGGSSPQVSLIGGQSGVHGSIYGGAAGLFNAPAGVSANGLIADTGNNVIAHFDAPNQISLLSGAPPPATRGFDNGSAVDARYAAPSAMSDGPDFTYVADSGNHAIRRVSRTDGSVTTLAGDGTVGFDDGANPHFNNPQGVLFMDDGVVVADTGNHSIRKILFTGTTITLAGKAQDPGSTDGPAADARFRSPMALAIDAAGNIYIADAGNFTIRRLTPAGDVTTFVGQIGVEGFSTGHPGVLSAVRGLAVDRDAISMRRCIRALRSSRSSDDGATDAHLLRALREDMRILLVTGYASIATAVAP